MLRWNSNIDFAGGVVRRVLICFGTLIIASWCGVLPAAAALRASNVTEACGTPRPYPATADAQIAVTSTSPRVGTRIAATGSRFCPHERVTISVSGAVVHVSRTTASGAFTALLAVPGPAGRARLCAAGASGTANDRDCLILAARESRSSAVSSAAARGASSAASTGVRAAAIVAIGSVLLAGGLAFATAGRRSIGSTSTQ